MIKFLIFIPAFVALGIVAFLFYNRSDTHVFHITIARSYDTVWDWVSEPKHYPELYPHWVKKVTELSPGHYQVDDQFGGSYPVDLIANREFGIVDLHIHLPVGEEVSRGRIFPINDQTTVLVHLAHRWRGANPMQWFFHKLTTARDFKNTKKIIEAH